MTKYYVTPDGNNLDIGGSRRRTGDTVNLTARVAEAEHSRGTIETPEQYDARQKAIEVAKPAKPAATKRAGQ